MPVCCHWLGLLVLLMQYLSQVSMQNAREVVVGQVKDLNQEVPAAQLERRQLEDARLLPLAGDGPAEAVAAHVERPQPREHARVRRQRAAALSKQRSASCA